MAEVNNDKVEVAFSYYRDANGTLRERRKVWEEVIYDEPVLLWHRQKPWYEIEIKGLAVGEEGTSMSMRIVVPENIFGGWSGDLGPFRFGFLWHSLQSDQRWIFLVRLHLGRRAWRFGYRTKGEATPQFSCWHEWGWFWPWKWRSSAGRG